MRQNSAVDASLGRIRYAFPGSTFPVGAVHEFISHSLADHAATAGFLSTIMAALMGKDGISIWIGPPQTVFPPALKLFDIAPHKVIFIELYKEREISWAMEEALKCEGLSAVVAEMKELSFNASRRLQLAVEQTGLTGFIIRQQPGLLNITACVTRWEVSSLSSRPLNGMPGVGFPRWNVNLVKVRNGKPGNWEVEFVNGRLRHENKIGVIPSLAKTKAG